MTYDMPDGRPTKTPDGRRNLVLIVFSLFAAAVLAVLGVTALTGSDDQANSTGGSGSAENSMNFMFMAKTETSLAKLDMTVGPSGQITGTHVWVRFDDDGEPFGQNDEEPFDGTYTNGRFELTGLSDTRSAYIGTLDEENGILTMDGTFGVSATEWTQIQDAAEFDNAVREFPAEPVECEDEGRFGCGES